MLKISLPTMKRWLKGNGVLLRDWVRMLDMLNLTLVEIAKLAEGELSKKFFYSLPQEQEFAKEDGLLAFFDALLKGKTVSQIARHHSLSERSVIFYLSRLEKIGLIEWLPKNKVKLLVAGEPNWIKGGPLSKKFRRKIIDAHMSRYIDDSENLKIAVYSLGKESSQRVRLLMSEFVEKIRIFEIKDGSNSDSKKLTTLILGMSQDEPPFLCEVPNR